jgi:O-antigen/teichoic acid export membrane protein
LLGVIVVLALGEGIRGLLFVYVLTAAAEALSLLLLSRLAGLVLELVSWRQAPLSLLRGEYRRIGRFVVVTNGHALFNLIRNVDILLIGYWLSPVAAGYFRAARSITALMNFPLAALHTASYPEFASLWHQSQSAALRRLLRKLVITSLPIVGITLLIIVLGGEWVIRLTVGEDYLPALPLLRWLAVAVAIGILTNFAHSLLLAIGRESVLLYATMAATVVQIGILVMLLPTFGVVMAGISHIGYHITWLAVLAFAFWLFKRRSPH